MDATHTLLHIQMNPMTNLPKLVAAWEVPIYEVKYEGQVQVGDDEPYPYTGLTDGDTDTLPDAKAEYARLVDLHGYDPDTKRPYAELAYGVGSQGVKRLDEAIHEAFGREYEKPAKAAAKKKSAAADSGGEHFAE